MKGWSRGESEISGAIEEQTEAILAAYAADPDLVEEHAGQEREARTGGYGRRQIFELVQNGADQLDVGAGRLEVVLTDSAMYCANEGRPFAAEGLVSLLHAYLSRKDDEQIGRFGLGFKSVLGVTSRPTVLSRSGSFRFAPEVAERIREAAPNVTDLPLLRVAATVDPDEVVAQDPVAAQLADWASTVVILPFDEVDGAPWLAAGLRRFPSAFLAFADHVDSLTLEDRSTQFSRTISVVRDGSAVSLRQNDESESWLVFEADVSLDEKARDRAGKLADRSSAIVKWAVRPEGSRELGEFWSYFPTDDETTLRGVVNAPWQMSEDRRRLVEGPYNEALLEGAAELVLDSVEALREHEEDKTVYLEILPARGREPRCWADGLLTQKANDLMRYRSSVPLLSGELEQPAAARLHPADLPEDAIRLWVGIASTEGWIDHQVDLYRDRRARVERYLADAGKVAATPEEWFAAVLDDSDSGNGIAIARLAGLLSGDDAVARTIRSVPFVLTEDLTFVSPDTPGLMLPGEYAAGNGDITLVHPELSADPEALTALEAFGLRRISAEVELRRLVSETTSESTGEWWERLWAVARQTPVERALAVMTEGNGFEPRVRTVDGDFRRIVATLLPGPCIPADGSRDTQAMVDVAWHRDDIRLLRGLGCTDGPSIGADVKSEPWFAEYRDACLEDFLRRNEPARPSEEAIELVNESITVGPLAVLSGLSEEGGAAVTQFALQGLGNPVPWLVRHSTQSRYETASVPNPSIWLIREEGLLPTPLGPRSVADCVGPALRIDDLTPAPSCSTEVARALGLPLSWSAVSEEVVEECLGNAAEADPSTSGRLYADLAAEETISPPELIRCIQGGNPTTAPRKDVAVSADPSTTELLAGGSSCVLQVADPESALLLVDRWGLKDAKGLVAQRIAVAAEGDPISLVDEFPPLRKRLAADLRGVELQRCEEIRIIEEAVGGTRSLDVDFARDGGRLYCLAADGPQDILRGVSRELGLGLSTEDVERIIRGVEDRRARDLIRAVRAANSDAERIASLIDAEALKAGLPRAVLEIYTDLHGEPSQIQLAQLAISVHGTDVLRAYGDDLEDRGLTPPSTWRGSRHAKEFVKALGFPVELAGFKSDPRPPEVIVEGRPRMPPLHEYQTLIVGELCSLFGLDKDNRGMLTLPTGSGKTRVAIEGCIEAISKQLLTSDLILWVAQSDELCEQAVRAWGELWRARELEPRLTISRLWGGNAADLTPAGAQVVVATIQKLQTVISSESYEWLAEPGAVIIDEAHGSITPSYTRLLEWLGLDRGKFGPPLVGLSATPYRGRSGKETERLAKRYAGRRLDVSVLGEGDHYPKLQREGVISRVEHDTLEGSDISLSEQQRQDVVQKGWLPKEADTRLGENMARTKRVLDHICMLPDDWPVLVFAPSVENAQALAGLLDHRGVSAATISGETPDEARRWYLKEFRENRLRVITNYSVLAEGFDAPSVRAVYIARPVFAPNRYQQMIGRGLRGPKNGGKEECLIVDVEDNVVNFDELLAFRQFEYLWNDAQAGDDDGE